MLTASSQHYNKLKREVLGADGDQDAANEAMDENSGTPKTPKKRATPRKRKADLIDGEDKASPTPRKARKVTSSRGRKSTSKVDPKDDLEEGNSAGSAANATAETVVEPEESLVKNEMVKEESTFKTEPEIKDEIDEYLN